MVPPAASRLLKKRDGRPIPAKASSGAPSSASMTLVSGCSLAEKTGNVFGSLAPKPVSSSPLMMARSSLASPSASGVRSGPAGISQPLPMPKLPSKTPMVMLCAREGFCMPSSIRITSCVPPSAIMRAPRARSRETRTSRPSAGISGSSPQVAASWMVGSTQTGPVALPPWPRERRAGARPRATSWSNSQATNGVLPAPPAVRFPTQITGTGAR